MKEDAPKREELEDEVDLAELEAEDVVIGQAFRISLSVIVVVGTLVAAIVWWAGREPEALPALEADVAPPVAASSDVRAPDLAFTDVTSAAGIDFTHFNGATGDKFLPETMGGGSAFLDHDSDGDPDLLFVNGRSWPGSAAPSSAAATCRLYANDGQGAFTDVTESTGMGVVLYGMGVAVGDADCDGDCDVYLSAVGPNVFLRNQGGRFEQEDVGVAGDDAAWGSSAAFFDADGDGDLDLVCGNYVQWSSEIDSELDYRLTGVGRAYGPPANYSGSFPYLFRNDGKGLFEDVSEAAGMMVTNPQTGNPVAKTLGVVTTDIDDDGDIDLVLANDTVTNFLFINKGDGTFSEESAYYGLGFDRQGRATGAMGIDVARYRDDGTRGIAIANFANEMSSLYVAQERGGFFLDEAISEGVGAPSRKVLSFGLLFLDVDLDGRLDLLQANGHLESEISLVQASQSYEQPAQLFWNAGPDVRRTFIEVEGERLGDLAKPAVGRGLNMADIDGDGDLDVLLTQSGRTPRLLRNDQTLGNHWLRVRLVGKGCNRDAINARVEVTAGGHTLYREVRPARSYLSQVEKTLTFGLGKNDQLESVKVYWPDGSTKDFGPLAVDREHVLEP